MTIIIKNKEINSNIDKLKKNIKINWLKYFFGFLIKVTNDKT
jgi:hypothetical protein